MPPTQLICPRCGERYGPHLAECPTDRAPLADARVVESLLGRAIGNFEVERLLGAGGMGLVFRAKHRTIGTPAVVKILSGEGLRHAEARLRFLNEAKLASAISHPNVVRIFDFGETIDRYPYMVMEYVPGDDLETVLRAEKRLAPLRAARLLRQVASGLEAAHQGPTGPVIHRDLKPANIRVTRRGREEHATVLDFGIAKALEAPGSERLTREGMVIGTPRYMAPEQACGDPVDARTDVYALGVIAYELVAGTTPFQTSRLFDLVGKQLHQSAPPFDPSLGVPKPYADIVYRCLAKEPRDRYPSAGALAEALEAWIEDERAAVVRRKAFLGVAAALLLGALGAGAAYFLRPPGAGGGAGAQVLELRALAVDGRDATGAPTVFVRGERARVLARIGGLAEIAGPSAEVAVSTDGRPAEGTKVEGDAVTAVVGPLEPGRRAALVVAVEAGPPGERRALEVLRRPIQRDDRPPALSIRPAPGAARFGVTPRGVYIFREAAARFLVGIDEDGALPPGGASARAEPPAAARVESAGAGQAVVALDLSVMRANQASLVDVRVADAAENEARLTVPIVYDPVPPQVEIAEVGGAERDAASGTWVVEAAAEPRARDVRVRVRASDAQGVAAIEPSIVSRGDGEGPVASVASLETNEARTEASIVVSLRREGECVLAVRALDLAGGASETALPLALRVPLRVEGAWLEAAPGAATFTPRPLAEGETTFVPRRSVALLVRTNKPVNGIQLRVEPGTRAGSRIVETLGWRAVTLEPASAGAVPGGRGVRALLDLHDEPWTLDLALGDGPPATEAAWTPRWRGRFAVRADLSPPRIALTTTAGVEDGGTLSRKDLPGGALAGTFGAEDAVSGVVSMSLRAFGFRRDEDRAEAVLAARAQAPEGSASEAGPLAESLARGRGIALAVERGEEGRFSVRPSGMAGLALVLEARDRAGNARAETRSWRVVSDPPVVTAAPRSLRVRLHDPIAIEVTTGKPVASLTVNGSAEGVRKTGEASYVYEATMFLDSPATYEVLAVDEAGNAARREVRVEREDACWGSQDDGPVPIANVPALVERYRRDPRAKGCPNCARDAFSGRRLP